MTAGNSPAGHAPVLSCDSLCLVGPRGTLFAPLTFAVGAGELLCLVGPNGVGKSLLLRTLASGRAPAPFRAQGSLTTLGSRRRTDVVHLPQLQAPDVHMPFLLGEVASFDGNARGRFSWFDEEVAFRSWNEASGGERMRALLARVFTSEAPLLLLDEPFNHLDVRSARDVRESMRAYVAFAGGPRRTIVFVSHAQGDSEGDDESFPLLEVSPVPAVDGRRARE